MLRCSNPARLRRGPSFAPRPVRVALAGVAFAVIVVAAVGGVVAAIASHSPETTLASPNVRTLARQVEAALPAAGSGRHVYIEKGEGREAWWWVMGLTLELQRRGIPTTMRGWNWMVGSEFFAPRAPPGATSIIVAAPDARRALLNTSAVREIAAVPEASVFRSDS